MLPPGKTLQAFVPAALLSEMQYAAAAEQVSVDEFVADAIERRLNWRVLDEVLAFGKRHPRTCGLTPGDVAKAIAAEPTRNKARGH